MKFPGKPIAIYSMLAAGTIGSLMTSLLLNPPMAHAQSSPIAQAANKLSNPNQLNLADRRVAEMQLITPGERLGLVDFDATYDTLVKTFGKSQLKDAVTYGPEGIGQWPATIVEPSPGYRFKVTWADQNKDKITRMTIAEGGEGWRTAEGIGIGSRLSKLQRTFGSFNISGFGWDYGNMVQSNNPKMRGMSVRVDPDTAAVQQNFDDFGPLSGDQMLRSSDPRLSKFDIKVARIELFPRDRQSQQTALIVPGEGVGAIRFDTSYAMLAKQFGRRNLTDSVTYGPEGIGQWPATIVNAGPDRQVKVTWKDANKQQITRMTIGDAGKAWRTANGLSVGSPLRQLQTALGKFRISGFGWDYGNRVLSENPKVKGLSLQLSASQAALQRHPKTYQSVLGDQTIQSTDSRLPRLGLQVNQIEVWAPLDR